MSRAPEEKIFVPLKEYDVIPKYATQASKADYHFRIVKAAKPPIIRFDIREHIVSERFTGYTGRGITITSVQLAEFISIMRKAEADLSMLEEEHEKRTRKKNPKDDAFKRLRKRAKQ